MAVSCWARQLDIEGNRAEAAGFERLSGLKGKFFAILRVWVAFDVDNCEKMDIYGNSAK
jgi:hypothetical protein